MLTGRVTDFDAAAGLGRITDSGGTSYLFHCIEIIDGTRTIDVGQAVTFEPLPRFGAYQAGAVDKG
jgi:CspA family cold shock protein